MSMNMQERLAFAHEHPEDLPQVRRDLISQLRSNTYDMDDDLARAAADEIEWMWNRIKKEAEYDN